MSEETSAESLACRKHCKVKMNLNSPDNILRLGRPLHVGGPNVGDRKTFDRLVNDIFERRWFTNNGEVLMQFERQLADHLEVRNCIPVCNATVGLQLACAALGLSGEVIVPSFTFVASAHSLSWLGLKPVFADVDRESHCLCPESVRSLITDKTSAILGVHLWGNPCRPRALQGIADEYGLKLIFDAAHAFHCRHDGTAIANFGDCEVFSFHATKFFNTFEGGAITTNDDQLAAKIRMMGNFGFEGRDQIACVGTNAKMTEISAAMGISMFQCIDQLASKNQRNYEIYQSLLGGVLGLKLYSFDAQNQTSWQYIVLEVDENIFGGSRDFIVDMLIKNNIFAKRYFYPGCHRMRPYQAEFDATGCKLENTDFLSERTLCLPTGSSVGSQDIMEVCAILLSARSAKAKAAQHGNLRRAAS